jgi:hypothetical protein
MFYLRPNNARVPDQLRRNHVTQYVSFPDWSWERTRKETPGRYESYVDLEVGAWTKVRVVVAGETAELYVNGAAQPCLIVNDLKLGPTKGAIGLWVGSGTDAYFANLRVVPKPPHRDGDARSGISGDRPLVRLDGVAARLSPGRRVGAGNGVAESPASLAQPGGTS